MLLGKTYRKLREEKGISLTSIAGYEISKSQISRFELGETEISVLKLFYLLEQIGVTLEEFLISCNDYEPSNFQLLIDQVRISAYKNNLDKLRDLLASEKELYEDTHSKYHKLNSIFIQGIMVGIDADYSLNETDKAFLTDYLFSVENWGYYEILLLGNCCRALPPELLFYYTKEALQKGRKYSAIQRNKEVLIQLLLNTLIIMIEEKMSPQALFLLSSTKTLLTDSTLFFELTIRMYLEGYYELNCCNHPEKAKTKTQEALKIFHNLNHSIYDNYFKHYSEYIKPRL